VPVIPANLPIQTEIVLEGDRGQGLVFSLNRHSLLGFNGLMQPIRPAPSGHGAPGELIDDDHFVFANDVFHIAVKQSMRRADRRSNDETRPDWRRHTGSRWRVANPLPAIDLRRVHARSVR
jgi:hypothetical protein